MAHDRGVGQVDADFDDDGGDEDIGVAVGEVGHDGAFVVGGHAAVEEPDSGREFAQRAVAKELVLVGGGFDFQLVGLFDQWTDDEALPTLGRLLADALVDDRFALGGFDDLGADSLAAGREFVDDGGIEFRRRR